MPETHQLDDDDDPILVQRHEHAARAAARAGNGAYQPEALPLSLTL